MIKSTDEKRKRKGKNKKILNDKKVKNHNILSQFLSSQCDNKNDEKRRREKERNKNE